MRAEVGELNARRSVRRRAVNLAAFLEEQAGGETQEVAVLDLSEDGFRMSVQREFEPGAAIWVKFPGHEVLNATIIWSGVDECGCKLETTLHPAAVALLVEQPGSTREAGVKKVFGVQSRPNSNLQQR